VIFLPWVQKSLKKFKKVKGGRRIFGFNLELYFMKQILTLGFIATYLFKISIIYCDRTIKDKRSR